ncbi:MAG: DUF362 domain-containing protein [Desulfobacteraceae bacterium]|nr:MAG: DUF362 domain-containing protein [Desulfobacteraceae bacterium]
MLPRVSLVKYQSDSASLQKALQLCEGFAKLKQTDRVLIKPNLVAWEDRYPIAPFGVYTTTRLVEDLIILLQDFGCRHISIGEGSVQIQKSVGTMQAFEGLGYRELEKRYDVNLLDLNKSKTEKFVFHDDLSLHIAKDAVDCDFLINFPVLKTHGQTKVSLGLKNLKGCLKLQSKKMCHHAKLNLEYCFSHIADFLKPALTIVDGIYALEKGALHFGNAYRKDLIIASTDILGADIVAAKTIGYDSGDIKHFEYYAKRHDRSLLLQDYEILGEKLEDQITPLKWDWTWTADNTGPGIFQKFGITGVALPKYDDSLCSGCSPIANMANILVLSAFKGRPLPKVEILNGKKMQARPGYEKTILLGNCIKKANEANPNIQEAVEVIGCPPSEQDVVTALKSAGLEVNETVYHGYMKEQSRKYDGKAGFEQAFFQA